MPPRQAWLTGARRHRAPAWLVAALALLIAITRATFALAAEGPYDAVIVGEGPVGLAAAIKIKQAKPDANVALYEKRALDRAPRPNTPTYFLETLHTLSSLGVEVNEQNFTILRAREKVGIDGTVERTELEPPKVEPRHRPYSTTDMLNTRTFATTSIGNTEGQLRAIATKLGVDIHYQNEVTSATNVPDGVDLAVKGKDGARTIHASYAVVADGSDGLGSRMAQPTVHGAVPMMVVMTRIKGDGSTQTTKFAEPTAPEGHLIVTRIGAATGVSILAELPPRLEGASAEEKEAWFNERAQSVGVKASDFLAKPSSFPAQLSEGTIGHGRVFVIGDAAGTVPIITGSGINKGLRQAVDTGGLIAFTLNHPTLAKAFGPALVALHNYREQKAQHELVVGIQATKGPRLRPVQAPVSRPEAPTPAPPFR